MPPRKRPAHPRRPSNLTPLAYRTLPASALREPQRLALAITTLPAPLRETVEALEPHVGGLRSGGVNRSVYAPLVHALEAWLAGDVFACHSLLDQATSAARRATADPHASAPDAAAAPEKITSIGGVHSFHARLPDIPDTGRVVYAATDASWNPWACGYGYMVTNGHWGAHGARLAPLGTGDKTPNSSVIHELRAIAHLFAAGPAVLPADRHVVLFCDSLGAQDAVRAWQNGDLSYLPRNEEYLRERGRVVPSLSRLADMIHRATNLNIADVQGHSGHPLNDVVDEVANMVRRRAQGGNNHNVRRIGNPLVRASIAKWNNRQSDSRLAGTA